MVENGQGLLHNSFEQPSSFYCIRFDLGYNIPHGADTVKIPDNIVELAICQARKSPMLYRHGAVLWKDGNILQTGYNFPVVMPRKDAKQFSIHAERDCLKGLRADQIYGSTLISVRITNKQELLTSSRPCKGCMRLLRRRRVDRVFWFDSDGNLNRTYLNR